ncbi:Serine/threonine-protein kinase PrkC [Stieleria maiorica]|uniref:Serine/threonine-protein kinase PrkC n=1 Tax=Stieleria maiorica TaxID=2795974 RepID=A0A5B9M9X3_9BACT|nr:serine/threonine-protein kinase [Stieleria maiorica]QEF96860.1 Serine/threonine-protein kinase PrkC [Stieleria maiorica]
MTDRTSPIDDVSGPESAAAPPVDPDATTDVPLRESASRSPVDPDLMDDLLERCLEQYLEAAPLASPQELGRFLPEVDLGTQRFLLVELIKLDMASVSEATVTGSAMAVVPRVEDYLTHFPQVMTAADVPLDLLMEEIQLRKESGELLDPADYAKRFPQHDSMIAELLGGQLSAKPEATAAAVNRKRPPEFQVGQQIDDFVIVQTLGSGAFANVYLARQLSMSRLVALKVSRGTGDEPQALAQFDHPNIVRVYDQRMIDDPPAHLLYMQFHPGGTLADVVDRVRHTRPWDRSGDLILQSVDRSLLKTAQAVPERSALREMLGAMSWPMAVAWVGIHLSRALENAHRRGVMHRDVKPANVLLSAEGVPKLADFNVSFAGSAGRAGAASSFGGSIGYMAPEHLRAISATSFSAPEDVGPRADLYSLAILLWELWQGRRPFESQGRPKSWTDAVSQQLIARESLGDPATHGEDALARLLEKILRDTLAFAPEDRIGSGAELEARLILALHPDAAQLFDPEPESWHGWLSRQSPWWVAATTILVPNAIAGVYGFFYNQQDTLEKLFAEVEGLSTTFTTLVICINSVAYPLAVVLAIYFTRRVVKGLESTASGKEATEEDLFAALELAHRAAVIGGLLWCLAAILYPAVLSYVHPEFSRREVGHFFLSHVICGGVAAIYPFFGLSIYAISVLYPRMVRSKLNDPNFDRRVAKLVRRCERCLLLACLVPLMGVTLLLVSNEDAKHVMLIAIAATGLGLFAAFSAYRYILRQCSAMTPVLSSKRDSILSM